jgi:hypothetical protein
VQHAPKVLAVKAQWLSLHIKLKGAADYNRALNPGKSPARVVEMDFGGCYEMFVFNAFFLLSQLSRHLGSHSHGLCILQHFLLMFILLLVLFRVAYMLHSAMAMEGVIIAACTAV